MKYRREEGKPDSKVPPAGSRAVLHFTKHVVGDEAVEFRCPCDQRTVWVTSPPHGIEFDGDGALTINGSCGYRENRELGRPANWCHFHIRDGLPEMCADAQCPGGAK